MFLLEDTCCRHILTPRDLLLGNPISIAAHTYENASSIQKNSWVERKLWKQSMRSRGPFSRISLNFAKNEMAHV